MKYEKAWHQTVEGGWVLEGRVLNDAGKVIALGSFELSSDFDAKEYAEELLKKALHDIASRRSS